MDDWAPLLEIPETTDPIPETYDPTWPYNFKWSYNGQTGEIHVWRTRGSIDGRPYHRAEAQRLWGREPVVKSSVPNHDILGLASYTPAERKLNGDVVAPPIILVQAYYAQQPPIQLQDWFEEHFPGVSVRRARLAGNGEPTAWEPQTQNDQAITKWVWNRQDGMLVWQTMDNRPMHEEKIEAEWGRPRNPGDFMGWAVPNGASLEIDHSAGNIPPLALQQVKQELAELYPNKDIVAPDDYAKSLGVTFEHNPQSLMPQAAVEASVSPVETTDWRSTSGTSPLLVRAMRKVMGLPVEAATGADKDGAMVAIYIPTEVGNKIKQRGGEPVEDMHVTLAYFAEKAADRDDWDEVERIVEQIAKQHPALTGKVGGVGIFTNDDGDVLWASPNLPGLAELRDDIVEAVEDAGFAVSKEHGWTPHITLKYEFKGKLPKIPADLELKIDQLSFAKGDDQKHFDFEGSFEKRAMALRPEQLEQWITQNEPYAWHVTRFDYVPSILREGLKPWDEGGTPQYEPNNRFAPRPGHVYMHMHPLGPSQGTVLRIDLRHLDPSRFDADEDQVMGMSGLEFDSPWGGEYDDQGEPHPWGNQDGAYDEYLGEWYEKTKGQHAEDNAHLIDQPDAVWRDGKLDTIAYRGTIPPEAISVVTSHHASGDYLDNWGGWQGSWRFVTDGKNVIKVPDVDQHRGRSLQDEFLTRYPDIKGLAEGKVIPTADGMGYGIHAPTLGFGEWSSEPGMHEVMKVLDDELGKPTHFVEDRHLDNPEIYDWAATPEGSWSAAS